MGVCHEGRHGGVLGKTGPRQVVSLVLQGREGLQVCRGGQGWTKSNQKSVWASILACAHKVFD
jgi:hypothetical protein